METNWFMTTHAFSCELEDWFHILASDKVPKMEDWSGLTLCAERNVERLLQLFEDTNVHITFFCLGWMAERMPQLVRKCQQAGHEIASHGYGHVMAWAVGASRFREDIVRSKRILEDIIGREVVGFRAPGFSVRSGNKWFFDVVAESGYRYDASVFPAHHSHGGLRGVCPSPHIVPTTSGPLVEIPASTIRVFGRRVCLFGGGYLRLFPLPIIQWGTRRLRAEGTPLIVYVHPREIDPDQPRLPLGPYRRFKCYVNLRSTMSKLKWLCEQYRFTTVGTLAARVALGQQVECNTPSNRWTSLLAATEGVENPVG
jgi:polysaccharide deacetylase family protein (PEP-CTERM system associated)